MKVKKYKFDGIYQIIGKKKVLATRNLVKGNKVYDEELITFKGVEYREWIPKRSKLAAAILKGIKIMPIKRNSRVLYLGAASGTTASHISDIAYEGFVYCIDCSPRVVRDLIFVCKKRKNMFPLLADASKPLEYLNLIGKCDIIYQDIAQRNQAEILIKNAKIFLKKGDYALFAVKSRSIDVTKSPKKVFEEVEKKLKEYFEILDKKRLEPFEKDHCFFILKVKT